MKLLRLQMKCIQDEHGERKTSEQNAEKRGRRRMGMLRVFFSALFTQFYLVLGHRIIVMIAKLLSYIQ